MTDQLQQLLGKHYKWLYIAKYQAKNGLASLTMNCLYLFAGMLEIGTYIYLYYINKSIDFNQIIAQFLLIRLYSSFIMNRWYYFVGDLVYSSGMTRFLLVPTNYFGHQLMLSIGGRLIKNLMSLISNLIIVGCVGLIIGGVGINFSALWLLIFVPIGFFLNFVTSLVIGHLAFFVKDRRDYNSFTEIYYMVFGILSGVIIPLTLLPNGYQWLQYTPFAYITYQPIRFYYNPSLALLLEIFGYSIAWCIVIFDLNRWIFQKGLKRNEAVGL